VRETQKTERAGCPAEERVEPKGPQGVQSTGVRKTENGDSVNGREPGGNLLEAILDINNMFKAQERVIANRGAAGIDGMTVEELNEYLITHYQELSGSIRGGWYKPKPVKRVEIPKPDGGKRLLGVPTVIDRAD
jgi:retron-type reverse transcriptase